MKVGVEYGESFEHEGSQGPNIEQKTLLNKKNKA